MIFPDRNRSPCSESSKFSSSHSLVHRQLEPQKWESNHLETSSSNRIFNKDQNSNNIKELTDIQKLPLPNIKNLRKWINNDKKAS